MEKKESRCWSRESKKNRTLSSKKKEKYQNIGPKVFIQQKIIFESTIEQTVLFFIVSIKIMFACGDANQASISFPL